MSDDYKKDLEIDKHGLDRAWLNQALLYMEWGEKYAQAIFERDRSKENLDIVKAELDAKIRLYPKKYGYIDEKKPTEGFISNTVINQSEYKKANLAFAEATKNVNILGTAKEAFNHKRSALENLTKLHLSNYWADKDPPPETKESIEKKSQDNQKKALGSSSRMERIRERRKKANAKGNTGSKSS